MIGYDKWPANRGLLLHLTLEEMTGLLTHDRAKPRHPHTLNGPPAWNSLPNGLPYLDFNMAHPDWLECPQANTVDLDFIAGDFWVAMWVYPENLVGGARNPLFHRGRDLLDGWTFDIDDFAVMLSTHQAGAIQTTRSANNEITGPANWHLVGAQRSGASVRVIHNGRDVTEVAGVHINPLTSARDLHIGVDDTELAFLFDGRIAGGPCGPRIGAGTLTQDLWTLIYELERRWFGV